MDSHSSSAGPSQASDSKFNASFS